MTIYERIRQLRISLSMTQDDLARLMGYKDRSMITKIEAGKVDISQKKVSKFAEALHTTTSYLMGWCDEAEPPVVLSSDEMILVKGYRGLSTSGKAYMLQQLTAAKAIYGGEDADISADSAI